MSDISASATSAHPSWTRFLPQVARVLLGLVFFVFGLEGFLHFMPKPTGMPAGAMDFAMAMMKTGYLFQLLKGTETLCGLLLLLNRFVPLALAVLAPIVVNIVAFDLFLAPSGLGIGAVVALLEVYLAWSHRRAFAPLLAMISRPD